MKLALKSQEKFHDFFTFSALSALIQKLVNAVSFLFAQKLSHQLFFWAGKRCSPIKKPGDARFF